METIHDLTSVLPTIEIEGNQTVVLSGHCVITLYSPQEMRVQCGKLAICINGDGLELRSLDAGELAIGGTIASVGFETEG